MQRVWEQQLNWPLSALMGLSWACSTGWVPFSFLHLAAQWEAPFPGITLPHFPLASVASTLVPSLSHHISPFCQILPEQQLFSLPPRGGAPSRSTSLNLYHPLCVSGLPSIPPDFHRPDPLPTSWSALNSTPLSSHLLSSSIFPSH